MAFKPHPLGHTLSYFELFGLWCMLLSLLSDDTQLSYLQGHPACCNTRKLPCEKVPDNLVVSGEKLLSILIFAQFVCVQNMQKISRYAVQKIRCILHLPPIKNSSDIYNATSIIPTSWDQAKNVWIIKSSDHQGCLLTYAYTTRTEVKCLDNRVFR